MTNVKRIYVEKKHGYDIEAQHLYNDLQTILGVAGLQGARILHRYDISGIADAVYAQARATIFSEPPIDKVYDEEFELSKAERVFAIEYLPGQYDQRADSAAQCIQILTQQDRPEILSAKVVVLKGDLTDADFQSIKEYCINPVDSREAALDKPVSLDFVSDSPADVAIIDSFINLQDQELRKLMSELGLAMSFADLQFCQQYFREEHRNPTLTEIKVIDTYWSDHCRHTTFLTELENIEIAEGKYAEPIKTAYQDYLQSRAFVYGEKNKDVCLMDIATIAMKELRKKGLLDDLEVSEEINACSIEVDVDIDGQAEKWLVMFKNETHNHPTEIEPFGGAATCLGGAIRDPLSGRSYVYQAMRVTGSGDPRTPVSETLAGKLPQRKITLGAAAGYSSYGNQIGIATGQVAEIYDEGYVAKRMEIGAVIAAAPKENVIREMPQTDDVIILLGGRTGRDGCGGATGSSKEHTEESIFTCGAEVQKGNPPTERKIQRLFRNPEVSTMIKKCNDFGAGGVSVAIGELADSLEINLDVIPKKYDGLDGTELAISESQERMAVVVAKQDVERFKELAAEENLEATQVAIVTADNRLKMFWRNKTIVDLSREFLNTNGVKQTTNVSVNAPENTDFFASTLVDIDDNLTDKKQAWLQNLADLNVAGQKGIVERFDSTIGAGTVLMPFGGKTQDTPAEAMVCKIPVLKAETSTSTIMSYGYNPKLAKWSPFHSALYAVVEAAAKVVAVGGNHTGIRLTLQEYFEKLGNDPTRWGKPFSALLGAFYAQQKLGIPAIGGKDSMSGTFKDLDVPPTLVAFAVSIADARNIISPEFKKAGSKVVLVQAMRKENGLPDFDALNKQFTKLTGLIEQGKVLSAHTVKAGGIAEAISKMCFGNRIGVVLKGITSYKKLFTADYGSFVLELANGIDLLESFGDIGFVELGYTQEAPQIKVVDSIIDLEEAYQAWTAPLAEIFPVRILTEENVREIPLYSSDNQRKASFKQAQPRVLIPVFPGTNCEYDSAKAFENAGGIVKTLVFKNLTANDIEESIVELTNNISNSQIIMLPGGFSAGDEPEGSGKFIATIFRNPRVKEAIEKFLNQQDGLMLGICNGFQALIKLGLVPFGEIRDYTEESPTLTYNTIGRHISHLAETKIISNLSPWFSNVSVGDIHSVAISHGEGRFVASEEAVANLIKNGQVATQYFNANPNGSIYAIEGITSPDGRILGKMGHSERIGKYLYKNVPNEKDQRIFAAGVNYFK